MPSIDWPLEQLREYRPETYREPDFDDYWRMTMAEGLAQPLRADLIDGRIVGDRHQRRSYAAPRSLRAAGWSASASSSSSVRSRKGGEYPPTIWIPG